MKSIKILSLLLVVVFFVFGILGCAGNNTGENTGTTGNDDSGKVEDQPSGALQFELVGVKRYDSIGEIESASSKRKLYAFFFNVKNTSDTVAYANSYNMHIVESDGIGFEVEVKESPEEGFESFGKYIAPGKSRRLYFVIETLKDFGRINIEYYPSFFEDSEEAGDACTYSDVVEPDDVTEELPDTAPLSELDTTDYSYKMEQYYSSFRNHAFGEVRNPDVAYDKISKIVKVDGGYCWGNRDPEQQYPIEIVTDLVAVLQYLGDEGVAQLPREDIDKIIGIIEFWVDRAYVTNEWFWRDLREPKNLLEISIILDEYIDDELREKLANRIIRGIVYEGSNTLAYGGMNGIFAVRNTYYRACLDGNTDMLETANDYFSYLVRAVGGSDEGVHLDGAYFEHGFFNAQYAKGFARDVAEILNVIGNAGQTLETEKISLLETLVIDGMSWWSRNGVSDFAISGRTFNVKTEGMVSLAKALKKLENASRIDELDYVIKIDEDSSKTEYGCKAFKSSPYIVMRSDAASMYVRGANSDSPNVEIHPMYAENVVGRNRAYGGLAMFHGTYDPYSSILQYWDWSMIPGTTAFHETDEELIKWSEIHVGVVGQLEEVNGMKGTTSDYCGGYSDGKAAGLYMGLINEEGLTANKTYILYNDIAVCLGDDIVCTKQDNVKMINTTLEQNDFNNASYNGQPLGEEVTEITDGKAVLNGEFAYYNLDTSNSMKVSCAYVEGKWERLAIYYEGKEYEDHPIFKLWMEHGTNPSDASYAYAVRANLDGAAPADASGLPIVKVVNENGVQAVEFEDGTVIAVFHDLSKNYEASDGRVITATEVNRIVISYAK